MLNTQTSLPDRLQIITASGTQVTLVTRNTLGSGGEGHVSIVDIQGVKRACKTLWPNMRSPERLAKIKALIRRRSELPDIFVPPLEEYYDAKSKDFLGYYMEAIPDDYEIFSLWLTEEHRLQNNISGEDLITIFSIISQAMNEANRAGFSLADFNPNGILVLKRHLWSNDTSEKKVRIVDVDCMEFDNFTCPVITIAYADPRLADRARKKKIGRERVFSKSTDVFALAAMITQALTSVGPYEGNHSIFMAQDELWFRGLHLLHPDVHYPYDAVPFNKLPERLREKLEAVYLHGDRSPFTSDIFNNIEKAIDLNPRQSTPIDVFTSQETNDLILDTQNNIIDIIIDNSTIYWIERDMQGRLIYRAYHDGQFTQNDLKIQKGHLVRLLGRGVIYEERPQMQGQQTMASYRLHVLVGARYDIQDRYSLIGEDHKPIVGVSNGEHYYVDDKHWLYTQSLQTQKVDNLGNGTQYTRLITNPFANASVLMSRIGIDYIYFFYLNREVRQIALSPISPGQTVQQIHYIWGDIEGRFVCVLRRIEEKGLMHIRVDLVDVDKGVLITPVNSPRILPNDILKNLNAGDYVQAGGRHLLFYPTNQGVQREDLINGDTQRFDATNTLVNRNDRLKLFNDRGRHGMLAYDAHSLRFISV